MARTIRRGLSEIDPMFFIPEGVDELVYEEDFDFLVEVSEDSEDFFIEYTDESDSDETDYSDSPETPQVLSIVPPQIIRTGSSGGDVVDVIFEVDESEGAEYYEFRVTKI